MQQLARSINDCLIKYLMQLNHPEIAPDRYPSFYFDTTDSVKLRHIVIGEKINLRIADSQIAQIQNQKIFSPMRS